MMSQRNSVATASPTLSKTGDPPGGADVSSIATGRIHSYTTSSRSSKAAAAAAAAAAG